MNRIFLIIVALYSSLITLFQSLNFPVKFQKFKFNHIQKSQLAFSDNDNYHDLKKYLLASKELRLPPNCNSSFQYSSASTKGGHIVKQYFDYYPRDVEANEIVTCMKDRQLKRKEIPESKQDKRSNPLIAISGSPGIGKSTFLCQFPESKEFRDYCTERQTGKSAIVSTLTFNSGMAGSKDYFQLRIIYGAIKAMGLDDISWQDFFPRFENYKLDYIETITLLKETFGYDRPILIMVDELSKAKNDKNVMTTIGDILNLYDECDVVVSSLSPTYIRVLLTGSQRKIDYVIIQPLAYTDLGKTECELFVKKLINKIGSEVKLDKFKLNLLKNMHLLLSGHPRSIENLVERLQNEREDWSEIISCLSAKKKSFGSLLKIVLDKTKSEYSDISEIPKSSFYEFVFRFPVIRSVTNKNFRILIEKGLILIYEREGDDEFITCVQLQSILYFISRDRWSDFKGSDKRLNIASYFLENLLFCNGIGIMWEKIISLNIVLRSYERMSISDVFGIDSDYLKIEDEDNKWEIKIDHGLQKRSAEGNQFFSPVIEAQPGNDGFVTLIVNGKLHYFYLQMKIQINNLNQKLLMKKVLSMISYNLLEHMRKNNNNEMTTESYNNVHMILYVWNLKKENFDNMLPKLISSFPTQEMNELITLQVENIRNEVSNLPGEFNDLIIKSYIDNNWGNIHFVGYEKMKTWLSPSFLSFPLLATALESL